MDFKLFKLYIFSLHSSYFLQHLNEIKRFTFNMWIMINKFYLKSWVYITSFTVHLS